MNPNDKREQSDTPRMDATLGKGSDWVFAEGCRLERELAIEQQAVRGLSALNAALTATLEVAQSDAALRSSLSHVAQDNEFGPVTNEELDAARVTLSSTPRCSPGCRLFDGNGFDWCAENEKCLLAERGIAPSATTRGNDGKA